MVNRTPTSLLITSEQVIQFGLSLGFTRDQLQEALDSLVSANEEKLISSSNPVFTLTLDYSQSKKQMILAGKYNHVNDFLRDNDPVEGAIDGSGAVEVTLELVHLNRVISTKDAISEIKKRGFLLAKIEHLLALGAKHPEFQKEFPIVALGSVWQDQDGDRDVPCLWRGFGERDLRLVWIGDGWYKYHRFLVLRK